MKTIVQDYGPIYGEAVNGTVLGRPNGSIFVPSINTVTVTLLNTTPNPPTIQQVGGGNTAILTNPKTKIVATAQDVSSYIRLAIYSDSACTTLYCGRLLPAGQFNHTGINWFGNNNTAPTTGQSYYLRAELFNNGSMVSASTVTTVVGL